MIGPLIVGDTKKCQMLVGGTLPSMENGYFLQRFIHENLASVTKIVVHIVDGIHRVTAIDCTLIGYLSPSNDDDARNTINEYGKSLPHQYKEISMTTYIPLEIDEKLLQKMKRISSKIRALQVHRCCTIFGILTGCL